MHRTHQEIFTPQYTKRSGPGSTLEYSEPYRVWLSDFILNHAIRSVLDLGCGDMIVMSNVNLHGAKYHGVDVIAERIADHSKRFAGPDYAFDCADLRSVSLDADLILCKDVIQHWSTGDVTAWLGKLREQRNRFRFALITNCNYGPTVNQNISTGGWRALDLTKPPFSIGEVVFQWGRAPGGFKDVVLIKGTG